MPTTLIVSSAIGLTLLAAALISGRAFAANLSLRLTRYGQPRSYWMQVAGLCLITAGLLIAALHASPVLVNH